MMSVRAIWKVTRCNDWWGCKMSPLLAVGYGTALLGGAPLPRALPCMLLLLGGLVAGGVYASAINDLSDIREDAASGKENRISRVAPRYRLLIPLGALTVGVVLAFYLLSVDVLTAILYALPCLSFTLYSLEPFRLKRRGFWGVLADASGAHIFPTLSMVAGTSAWCGMPIHWTWFCLAGLWSAGFGLRGILWHQFQDRACDLKVGIRTFATGRAPERMGPLSLVITVIELGAFAGMMIMTASYGALPLAALYLLLLLLRRKGGLRTGMIVTDGPEARQILMLDYYTAAFPLAVLLGAITQPETLLILLGHFVLFPLTPFQLLKEGYRRCRALLPSTPSPLSGR